MVEHFPTEGEEPAVTLDAFLDQSNATAVRLEPDDDARALIPHLDRLALIEIAFPKYRDGRGYSSARILREAGYTGELRAQGDVLVVEPGGCRARTFDLRPILPEGRGCSRTGVETASWIGETKALSPSGERVG